MKKVKITYQVKEQQFSEELTNRPVKGWYEDKVKAGGKDV